MIKQMTRFYLVGLLLSATASSALADWDTYGFDDFRKPHGQERGDAERNADLLACGTSDRFEVDNAAVPALVKCMRQHGWRVAGIKHTRTWIDRDTGGTCYHGEFMGMAAVQCTPGDHSN
jgi:hypothetical protein